MNLQNTRRQKGGWLLFGIVQLWLNQSGFIDFGTLIALGNFKKSLRKI